MCIRDSPLSHGTVGGRDKTAPDLRRKDVKQAMQGDSFLTVLVIMLTQRNSVYFWTDGYDLLEKLKTNFETKKNKLSPRKSSQWIMSYEIILRYEIGAKTSLTVAADRIAEGSRRGPITYPKKTPLKHPEANEK